ncbi:aldehyde dehydrogenase family protein [Burkholderia cepacia]|uniref:aldehyde dehydrogenase family protein n=1 Tax=Burkholderia cepacia TaxID=292 RepID=UPI002AB6C5BB|nr:aldehyde dehydrogenase family protein [Burkholderia cepacia]
MNQAVSERQAEALPKKRDLYYGGAWHAPRGGYSETFNPGTGESLGCCAEADAEDVNAAASAARNAFESWRFSKPLDRAAMLRKAADILRANAEELALIDAQNCGNPVSEMANDVLHAAAQIDFFAGLVTEVKGETIPMGGGVTNLTVREPLGVCARIVAYNHPLMFSAGKFAAPIAAGNTVIIKPPQQAPLSALRMMELLEGVFPPGVLNIVTGGVPAGEALVAHPQVPMVTLIGSVPTGRAIARQAANQLKQLIFELGGKNALVVFPDADVDRAIEGAVRGMNFTWCGQSCGSTSRLFVHESVHDRVLAGVLEKIKAYRPGIPTDPATTMGAIISKSQLNKVLEYIEIAKREGAVLVAGGTQPTAPDLQNGFYVDPTVFSGVKSDMRIAQEEVFGPILSVLKWSDEETLFSEVNSVEYGLTASIFTKDLATAHRAASRIESGFIWVNRAGPHFLGAPYGGYKQSGIGREESIDELMAFTQIKNINIAF